MSSCHTTVGAGVWSSSLHASLLQNQGRRETHSRVFVGGLVFITRSALRLLPSPRVNVTLAFEVLRVLFHNFILSRGLKHQESEDRTGLVHPWGPYRGQRLQGTRWSACRRAGPGALSQAERSLGSLLGAGVLSSEGVGESLIGKGWAWNRADEEDAVAWHLSGPWVPS